MDLISWTVNKGIFQKSFQISNNQALGSYNLTAIKLFYFEGNRARIDDSEVVVSGTQWTGPFPPEASSEDRASDSDFDGDGQTNGEEFAAGTDPTDPEDFFWSVVDYDPVEGFKIVFCPYLPAWSEWLYVEECIWRTE